MGEIGYSLIHGVLKAKYKNFSSHYSQYDTEMFRVLEVLGTSNNGPLPSVVGGCLIEHRALTLLIPSQGVCIVDELYFICAYCGTLLRDGDTILDKTCPQKIETVRGEHLTYNLCVVCSSCCHFKNGDPAITYPAIPRFINLGLHVGNKKAEWARDWQNRKEVDTSVLSLEEWNATQHRYVIERLLLAERSLQSMQSSMSSMNERVSYRG